jgi:hypothetical protein
VSDEPERRRGPRRPAYLLVAILTLWIVGVWESNVSFTILRTIMDPLSGALDGAPDARTTDAFLEAIRLHRTQMLPAYSAHLLINLTMFFVAVRLLFTGRANIPFALQVIGVNMAVLGYVYYVSQPIRMAHVRAVMPELQRVAQETGKDPRSLIVLLWWAWRAMLIAELLVLATCGFALTRERARQFMAWSARRAQEDNR